MNRRTLALALAGAALVAVGPVALPAPRADAALQQGYVSSTVTMTSADSYSNVGSVTFTRTAPGRYTIFARNLGGAGNAQLTMWDTGDRLPVCTVSSVARLGSGTRIKVRCNHPDTRRATDAVFSLLYNTERVSNPAIGYVALTTSSTGSSTPSNQYRTRGTGKAKVKRTATGEYQVTVPNETLDANGGVVMVSATGSSVRYCNPVNWNSGKSADATILVRCRTAAGTLANATFSLVVTTDNLLGVAGGGGGSAWSSSSDRGPTPSALGPSYSYNSAAATNTHVDAVLGQGLVTFPDVLTGPSTLVKLAVAYGSARCAHLGLHGLDGDDVTLNVSCQDAAGNPVDSSFSALLYIQPTIF